jgi:hypothetical protein
MSLKNEDLQGLLNIYVCISCFGYYIGDTSVVSVARIASLTHVLASDVTWGTHADAFQCAAPHFGTNACRMAASGNDHHAAYTLDQLVINLVPDFYITKDKLEPQST